jgi:FAD/FMN-containing dehydrogenase
MTQSPVTPAAIQTLRTTVSGPVLIPGDPGYDEVRRVHNGLIDRCPAVIVRAVTVADIVDAVRFARDSGLALSVRGGGHNVAGRACADRGLMLDLALMKGIHVDRTARTARAQGGVTWGEFNRATQLFGLATTGGVISTTGIGGLTLGGGLGWLMGSYGMAVDNVRSLEMVTADGQVVTASASEHPDLYWAARGAGANFGVAVSIEYGLHPVGPIVTGGLVAWPFAQAREVLRFYRGLTSALPDEMTAFGGLVHAPDGSGAKLAAILVCHGGPQERGEAAVAPVRTFGTPAMVGVGPIPYTALNGMLDAGFPRGALNYWKSSFLRALPDEAIDTAIERFARCTSPMSALLFEHFHGAATRVPVDATAYPHRSVGYNAVIVSQWLHPAASEEQIAWARESYASLAPFMAGGRYVNYLADDEAGAEASASAYGANYPRLRELKRRYDPENLFRSNLNIAP